MYIILLKVLVLEPRLPDGPIYNWIVLIGVRLNLRIFPLCHGSEHLKICKEN